MLIVQLFCVLKSETRRTSEKQRNEKNVQASGGITYPEPMGFQTIGTPGKLEEKMDAISAARTEVSTFIYEKFIPQTVKQANVVELPPLESAKTASAESGTQLAFTTVSRCNPFDQLSVASERVAAAAGSERAEESESAPEDIDPSSPKSTGVFEEILRPQLAKAAGS